MSLPANTSLTSIKVFLRHQGRKPITNRMGRWQMLLFLIVVALKMTACTNPSTSATASTPIASTPDSTVFFPQQKPVEGEREMMTAELLGELVSVDGCLRVNAEEGESYLIVWPPDVTLNTEGGSVQILDQTGQIVARTGEMVYLDGGGGAFPAEGVETELLEQPGALGDCPGPYWIVGNSVRIPEEAGESETSEQKLYEGAEPVTTPTSD